MDKLTFKELQEMMSDRSWASQSCRTGHHDYCFVFYDRVKVCHCSCHDGDDFDSIRERNIRLVAELKDTK